MYPQIITEAVDKYISYIDRDRVELREDLENDVRTYLEEQFFDKFLKGDDIKLDTEEEIIRFDSFITTLVVVDEMCKKGFVGRYRDDGEKMGDEVIYFTEKGKQFLTQYGDGTIYENQTNTSELHDFITGSITKH